MSTADELWSQAERWATRSALLLALGVVLVVAFARAQLLDAGFASVGLRPALKWALTAGVASVALVWAVAAPRLRAVAALVVGVCGSAVTLVGVVFDPYSATAAGYAVTLGTLSILLAGVLETERRFDWNRSR
ncbi:hypothetical protein C475_03544 [Halosimplex carlsbadense 2-9-1]|uniref:Uncharacterized protein n=1 Tax=Halosimplex carlsbadense 2-9-1 TaxID=797114 RepID=M0D504_9EURY|nr:hypothetical protein [Halosimplex carlsbadense]ELZ29259.1 hypothetical protein C475_03544 [Halosimplex carlsbadense 2-9-1]